MQLRNYSDKVKEYHFEFKHLSILFIVLLSFQLIVSLINKSSITSFLDNTQKWYQKDAVEKLANLTTTSLELIIESIDTQNNLSREEKARLIQSFNIIFSQQMLQHDIQELCILIEKNNKTEAIDDGKSLLSFVLEDSVITLRNPSSHLNAIQLYENNKDELKATEQIKTIKNEDNTYHVLIPFVIRGEYVGALYINHNPDFSVITDQLISSNDETAIIYVSLILLGFIAMYFISSYTIKERDEAQKLLFAEHEQYLKKQIAHEKELVFTKRIYHTHHKAEKIMGFIKEDLTNLNESNIDEVNYRVSKYSNFISRVIYDMKWFDPPVQTIRGPIYNTNLNEVLKFIVENIFLRISRISNNYRFNFNFGENLPNVYVNEFVIWELFEPLIQNCIEHSAENNLEIKISTSYNEQEKNTLVFIQDNGKGIEEHLLEYDSTGDKKIFGENISTKNSSAQNSGYGCYMAYQISRRCGWNIDADNNPAGGCIYTISIPNFNG
jgi:Histidine kinase-, DNA gyrase B-, and HSP90-like ATPase